MKNRRNYILGILLGGASILLMGCVNSLLDQIPTTELGNTEFWQTEEDATNGLMGAYADVRGLFSRDYYFDGQGEYVRVRDGSGSLSNTTTNITQGPLTKEDVISLIRLTVLEQSSIRIISSVMAAYIGSIM